jgi:hypothetical protein
MTEKTHVTKEVAPEEREAQSQAAAGNMLGQIVAWAVHGRGTH